MSLRLGGRCKATGENAEELSEEIDRTRQDRALGDNAGVRTTRMESFSDGVFSVAITLLSLSLVVPTATELVDRHETLSHHLLGEWPSYAAYVVSFLTIGIIWINHHRALERLQSTDHTLLVLNLFLLMSVVTLPFATQLVATYLRGGGADAELATAVYSGAFALMGTTFLGLNYAMLATRTHLLHERMDEQLRRSVLFRGSIGVVPYFVAIGLAVVSPAAAMAINGAVAIFYALPVSAPDTNTA